MDEDPFAQRIRIPITAFVADCKYLSCFYVVQSLPGSTSIKKEIRGVRFLNWVNLASLLFS